MSLYLLLLVVLVIENFKIENFVIFYSLITGYFTVFMKGENKKNLRNKLIIHKLGGMTNCTLIFFPIKDRLPI
jgi:hypothetical protein